MCETPTQLTPRKIEVVRLIVDGLTNQEIAERLAVAPDRARACQEGLEPHSDAVADRASCLRSSQEIRLTRSAQGSVWLQIRSSDPSPFGAGNVKLARLGKPTVAMTRSRCGGTGQPLHEAIARCELGVLTNRVLDTSAMDPNSGQGDTNCHPIHRRLLKRAGCAAVGQSARPRVHRPLGTENARQAQTTVSTSAIPRRAR